MRESNAFSICIVLTCAAAAELSSMCDKIDDPVGLTGSRPRGTHNILSLTVSLVEVL